LDFFILGFLWPVEPKQDIPSDDIGCNRIVDNINFFAMAAARKVRGIKPLDAVARSLSIPTNRRAPLTRSAIKIDWSKYTPFQKRVLKIVLKIPKGSALTYGEVAKKLGNSKLARSVGGALSKNMDAPVIPCHRVVGRSGLGGYSAPGGLAKKVSLLKKEGFVV
jgi:methylated-DNA-[protein]-cysteine S-methyltransferase